MNSRFIKNNSGLVVITSVCLVIAVIELGVVAVHSIQMYNNIQVVKDLSNKIRTITKKRPVPVEGNKAPIEEDIRIYEAAVQKLYMKFGRPTVPAVERFFQVLTIRKSAWLQDFDIDEKDEIVKRLKLRIGRGRKLETLSNREFDDCLDWLSAEELAKKVKALAPDDERMKRIKELIPQLDKLDAAALTKLLYEAAALGKLLPDVELSAADLAKRIKAFPADSAIVKDLAELIKDFDKLDEAALADRIAGEAGLSRTLQTMIALPEFAKRIKALPATGEAAKRIKTLVPDGDAAKVFVIATLDRKLREREILPEDGGYGLQRVV